MRQAPPGAAASDVSSAGVLLPDVDSTVDVSFDGRRIWSFRPGRDGRPEHGMRFARWPRALVPYLQGSTRVTVHDHVGDVVFFDREVGFDAGGARGGAARVEVADKAGHPLSLDKSGRLQRVFDRHDRTALQELLDATVRLLAELNEQCGVPAHLAYGCLLGAVREGKMIGHDFDADVSYLSNHSHPLDITLESFRIERMLQGLGWRTKRMSSDDFKVVFDASDGSDFWIDIFGSFYIGDDYYLMGEVSGKLPRSSILPLSTVELEGTRLTAPASPEDLLALTYGPHWRVPDPAFKFDTPTSTRRRLSGWMRGENDLLRHWDEFSNGPRRAQVPTGPTTFARWVADREEDLGRVVDVGTGTGRDARWFAAEGADVLGLDYSRAAIRRARADNRRDKLPIEFAWMNLYETREVLTRAAALVHDDPPGARPVVYARFLLDSLRDPGRANFWRFARMLLRAGGTLYLEFRTDQDRRTTHVFGEHWRNYLDPERVAVELRDAGATVTQMSAGRGLAPLLDEDPHVCRIVARWE